VCEQGKEYPVTLSLRVCLSFYVGGGISIMNKIEDVVQLELSLLLLLE